MPSTVAAIHRTRSAMGTLFEALLVGDDEEHLTAVAEAVLDEVVRIERLLSRFDPRSEISRINRLAANEPVIVDYEVAGLLKTCFAARDWTESCFDITASAQTSNRHISAAHVEFDAAKRRIRFTSPDIQLDLGGIGKGYALDRAAELLAEYGVDNALLHGGTSSVLARGCDERDEPWRIALRKPAASESMEAIELCDQALSYSAVNEQADIIDPRNGEKLAGTDGCAVIARSATEAEILSTALLCMGRERAEQFVDGQGENEMALFWMESIPAAVSHRLGTNT